MGIDTKYPKVSVVIPCRNEEKYIEKNIQSILNQEYKGEIKIFVVDGMSDDNTRQIVENFSESSVVLLDNPHQYTPHALNIGIEKSAGEYFVILGGHSFLDKDFIKKNVEILESNSEIGCSGGQIKNIYENEEGELIAKAMSSKFGVGNATFRIGGEAGFVDTVAFGMYRKEIHDQIDGFDETLVRNQDDEYNFKVTQAGYKIYFDPEIISHYYVRGSYSKLWKQYYQYGYWKVYVNKKHKTVTSLRQLVPLFFVIGLIIGSILSIFYFVFQFLLFAGIILYFHMSLMAGRKQTGSVDNMGRVAKVFPILHLSYGFGYLSGIFNFLILNKKPSNRSKALTRK
ncbi:MAG: glycosyltransferase family 2 protein [Flavobacteriales bacterium]